MKPTTVHAELRIVRVVSALLALGALGGLAALPVVVPRPGSVPDAPWLMDVAWWSQTIAVLIGLVAPWAGLVWLRRLHALNVVLTAAVLALSIVVIWAIDPSGTIQAPWLLSLSGASAVSAMIAWGDRAAWVTLVGTTAALQVLRLGTGSVPVDVLVNDLQALAGASAAVALVGALLEVSRHGDEVATRVIAAEEARAAEQARRSVRTRTQALVHDEVLAVLLLASHDVPSLRPAVARQAARARGLISSLTTPDGQDAESTTELAAELEAAAREVAPDARLEVAGSGELALPQDAATALLGAARQALQNSCTHAPEAVRRVRLSAGDEGVEIVVEDDGPGFDPARIPGARMGIRVSITGRMDSVAGGSAHVLAAPGEGTQVVLRWRPGIETPADAGTDDLAEGALPLGNLRLAVVLFLTAQVAAAVVASSYAEDPWVPVLASAGAMAGVAVLGWRDLRTPGRARTAGALVLATLTAALVWVPITGRSMSYADWSYLYAVAFVLAMLAVRGRPHTALAGLVPLLAMPVGAAAVLGYAWPQAGGAVARSSMLVLLSVASTALITRIRARTERLVATEMAVRREQGWKEARRTEARERMRDLERLTGRTLVELQAARPLTRTQIADCIALEGQLRDSYRGGRLARSPLVESAAAARRRGVDVVLLDDAPDRVLQDAELAVVITWMCRQVDGVAGGRFTGRILPSGRGALASAVTGEEATEFPG